MLRVIWVNNKSSRYDGKEQDIAVRYVIPECRSGMKVGSRIRVWLGRGKKARVWTAVVVDLLEDGSSITSKFQQFLLFHVHARRCNSNFLFENISLLS